MTEDRQEKNRRLARWLGFHVVREKSKNPAYQYKYKLFVGDRGYVNSAGLFGHGWHSEEEHAWFHAPDFYTSEDASGLLFDKLLWTVGCTLNAQRVGGDEGEEVRTESIGVHLPIRKPGFNPWTFRAERKEAVADAALAYIESLAQEKK